MKQRRNVIILSISPVRVGTAVLKTKSIIMHKVACLWPLLAISYRDNDIPVQHGQKKNRIKNK